MAAVLLFGVVAAACGDDLLGPDGAPTANDAAGWGLLDPASAHAQQGEPGALTFYCSVARRTRTGQEFSMVSFRLPARFVPEDGAHDWLVLEKVRQDGSPARTVICDVPLVPEAFHRVTRRFLREAGSPPTARPLNPDDYGLPARARPTRPMEPMPPSRSTLAGASLLPGIFSMRSQSGTGEAICLDLDQDGVPDWEFDWDSGSWWCPPVELDGVLVEVCGPESPSPECYELPAPDIYYDWGTPPPPYAPTLDDPTGQGPSGSPSPPSCDGDGGGGDGGGVGDGDGDGDGGGLGDETGDCRDPIEPEIVQLQSIAVECDAATVTRGSDLNCHVAIVPADANNFKVKGWKFVGGGHTVPRSELVSFPFWKGTVVVGGKVTLQYQVDGSSAVDTSTAWGFTVTDRTNGWSWTPTSTVLPPATWPASGTLATTDSMGATCWIDDQGGPCGQVNVALQPWPTTNGAVPSGCLGGSGHGFGCEEVSGGPNDGLWYVADAYWSLNRRSGIHPEFSTVRPFSPLVGCSPGDSPGTWAEYHDTCRGLNGSGFVAGLEAHEAGHVQQADTAAVAGLDPVTAAESVVRDSEADLITGVVGAISQITSDIMQAGEMEPTGNFNPGTDHWSFWGGTFYDILRTISAF